MCDQKAAGTFQYVNNKPTSEGVNEHAWFLWETEGGGSMKGVLADYQGVSEPMSRRISCERIKVKK